MGSCELTFEGFKDEKFTFDNSGTPDERGLQQEDITSKSEFFKNWLVSESRKIADSRYCISGLIEDQENYIWLDWSFSYANFRLTWNRHITWSDWHSGKQVED